MSLAREYKRQFGWRPWPVILDALPPLQGATVLDLGCGPGDLAAELHARGAHEELLREARSRNLTNAEFRAADLRHLPDLEVEADGIWCSFAAAYFPELPDVLPLWSRPVMPGGWVAITEVDDLFGHEVLSEATRKLFEAYADQSLALGRYDFRMGRKLEGYLEAAGFQVLQTLAPSDAELSFSGPAAPDVLDAWRDRFARLKMLQSFLAEDFQRIRDEFLACLERPDHASTAQVRCCIARKQAR